MESTAVWPKTTWGTTSTSSLLWSKVCHKISSQNFQFIYITHQLCITSELHKLYLFCIFNSIFTAAPFWISAPQNLILAPKETGMLNCRADGNPKPKVTWSVNGVPIESKFHPYLSIQCGYMCIISMWFFDRLTCGSQSENRRRCHHP